MIRIKDFLKNNDYNIRTRNQLEWFLRTSNIFFKPRRGFLLETKYRHTDDINFLASKENVIVTGYKAAEIFDLTTIIAPSSKIDVIVKRGYKYKIKDYRVHYVKDIVFTKWNIIQEGIKYTDIHKTIAMFLFLDISEDKEVLYEILENYRFKFNNFDKVEYFAKTTGIWKKVQRRLNEWGKYL